MEFHFSFTLKYKYGYNFKTHTNKRQPVEDGHFQAGCTGEPISVLSVPWATQKSWESKETAVSRQTAQSCSASTTSLQTTRNTPKATLSPMREALSSAGCACPPFQPPTHSSTEGSEGAQSLSLSAMRVQIPLAPGPPYASAVRTKFLVPSKGRETFPNSPVPGP